MHNVSRELVEIRSNVGTSFSRVFGWSGLGVSGLKHVIQPEISYLFIPGVNQSSIPIMDDVDRVNRRNIVTFAIANHLWGKLSGSPFIGSAADRDVENLSAIGATDVRELAALKLALSYDVVAARRGGDSLTDVDINLRFAPTTYINMTLDGGISQGDRNHPSAGDNVYERSPSLAAEVWMRTQSGKFDGGELLFFACRAQRFSFRRRQRQPRRPPRNPCPALHCSVLLHSASNRSALPWRL